MCAGQWTAGVAARVQCVMWNADVDGTLIKSIGEDANKLHKLAFAEVIDQLHQGSSPWQDCSRHVMHARA